MANHGVTTLLDYDSCKRYILGLRFAFEPESLNEDDHLLFVSSHIDLNQEAMIISMGMLIKFLEKYLPQINLNHEPIRIMFVNHISLLVLFFLIFYKIFFNEFFLGLLGEADNYSIQ